jgi:CHAT domain-containing protein
MATISRCLCLFLTLWMAGSKRPAVPWTVASDPWWGTQEAFEIKRAGERLRGARDFAGAEALDRRAYDSARQRHDGGAAFVYVTAIGAACLLQFHYRSALNAFLEARDLAARIGDPFALSVSAVNLSSLYLQTWDIDSAVRAAEDGISNSKNVRPRKDDGAHHGGERAGSALNTSFRLPLLLQLGRLHQMLGDDRAAGFFEEAIEEARVQGDIAQESRAWDVLGEEQMRLANAGRVDLDGNAQDSPEGNFANPEGNFANPQGNFVNADALRLAEHHFDEAFRLRLVGDRADLGFSYARLGALKLAQRDLDPAGRLTDRALAVEAKGEAGLPRYLLTHQRGEIRLARGDTAGALKDFAAAADQAGLWRREVLPAPGSLVAANIELEKRIFRSFTETAAQEALRTGDARLAAESFQAVEQNRAASLRESQALAAAWRGKLPPEYWQNLAELHAEQSQNVPGDGLAGIRSRQLQLALTEMEAKAGLGFLTNKFENFRGRTSLIHFQHGLSKSELFLSVYLGEHGSYMWVVTRTTLSMHRLPAAKAIRNAVQQFREAVRRDADPDGRFRGNGDQAERMGSRLYAELFGGLSAREAGQPEWLLSLDDALFQLPFAALVTEVRSSKMKYLVEQHSLQVVPGALSLIEYLTGANREFRGVADGRVGTKSQSRQVPPDHLQGPDPESGWFLGLGDPIYNTADPRWVAAQTARGWAAPRPAPGRFRGWFAYGATAGVDGIGQLSRLVGSASEVESSARNWAAGSATLLMGGDAQRGRFLTLAARHPAIIHLATHVVTPDDPGLNDGSNSGLNGRRKDALIAFGLDPSGQPGALSTSEVEMLDVPGAVVSMTGCESGEGDIQAGAGLLGLTRAWQMAGARAVIATGWPVSDTNGELFAAFYRHLRNATPAEALRRSQVEMIHSGTWRSAPANWASYQVTGGGR